MLLKVLPVRWTAFATFLFVFAAAAAAAAEMDGSHFGHKGKSHPAPESRVGEEGTSKRNITRKGGVKVCALFATLG